MALSNNLRGALYMNVSMAAFTINDAFMKKVTLTLPLYQCIALRGIIALAALLILAHFFLGGLVMPYGQDRRMIIWRSLADVVSTAAFLSALMFLSLANLMAILQFLPLAITLSSALILGAKIGRWRLLAIMISFIGVMLIIKPGSEGFNGYSLMGLVAVVAIVCRDLVTWQISGKVTSVTVAIWAASSVTFLGLVGALLQGWQSVSLVQMFYILCSATALIAGYIFAVMVMRAGDIGFIAPFRYMSLLWAIGLGWVFFDNFPDFVTLLGAAIVVSMGIFSLFRERYLEQQ
ncbi:MAG: drug/metabolite transporter (DMT)-like permease [Paracoccaceae bacterium]|jgi:drug/metabolite transporter (DMT)-like permease